METLGEIQSISDLTKYARKVYSGHGVWSLWRGQERDWPLIPGIYREGREENELDITNRFRQGASPRFTNCPARDDYQSWLFLMQHHRLPTRLLDWSQSALTSLFFAAMPKTKEPAVLYA